MLDRAQRARCTCRRGRERFVDLFSDSGGSGRFVEVGHGLVDGGKAGFMCRR